MFAVVHHSLADLGWLVVLVCVCLAIWQAILRNALAVVLLLAVAIIAAYLLL